jgi:hypothetical protein
MTFNPSLVSPSSPQSHKSLSHLHLFARIAAHERDPGTAIPWEQFEAGLTRRLGE